MRTMETLGLGPNRITGRTIDTTHRALINRLPILVAFRVLFRNFNKGRKRHVKCNSASWAKNECSAVSKAILGASHDVENKEITYNEPTACGMDLRSPQRTSRAWRKEPSCPGGRSIISAGYGPTEGRSWPITPSPSGPVFNGPPVNER